MNKITLWSLQHTAASLHSTPPKLTEKDNFQSRYDDTFHPIHSDSNYHLLLPMLNQSLPHQIATALLTLD